MSTSGSIESRHLPCEIFALPSTAATEGPRPFEPRADAMRRFERAHLMEALRKTDGHRGRAAELLGISRKTLWVKLRDYGI